MTGRFCFLVTCADFEEWIEECLRSIDAQDHDCVTLLLALDAPTDRSAARAKRCIAEFKNVSEVIVHEHDERAGKAQRVFELMEELRHRPEDIVAFLDGDDRVIHEQAARCMHAAFDRGADVAWSNFVYREARQNGLDGRVGLCRDLAPGVDPFECEYVSSHLFCFRAADFFDVAPENFLDAQGRPFTRGCDQCFTLPLVARTEKRHHVPEFFVEYNNATPWQNAEHGDRAARAVAELRGRGLLRGDARRRARGIAESVAAQLASLQLVHGDFPQPSYYAVACARAAWTHIDPQRYAPQIARAEAHVRGRQAAARRNPLEWPGYHWEFELFAATSAADAFDSFEDPGCRTNNERVLNWQLLLALVDARLELPLRTHVLDRVEANMAANGRLTDFDKDLVTEAPYSDQYQAFSAYLLDELARARPGDSRIDALAQRAGAYVVARARSGDVNREGRGRGQIFGYAAALRVLLAREEDELAHEILSRLQAARWSPGLFPLSLEDSERHFGMQASWEGYNRYFDYAAFLGLLLATAQNRVPLMSS